MPRTCTICGHEQRQAIDKALLTDESLRTIADRWSVLKTALIRHKAEHIPAKLSRAKRAEEVSAADDLLKHSRALGVRRLASRQSGNGRRPPDGATGRARGARLP